MDKKSFFFALLLALICFSSCSSSKNVPCLKDSEKFTTEVSAKSVVLYTVSTITNRDDAYSFNLIVPSSISAAKNISTKPVMHTYLVDNNGHVNYPVPRSIKLSGSTKKGAEDLLKEYLNEDPIVMARLANYKFSVISEVIGPNNYTL